MNSSTNPEQQVAPIDPIERSPTQPAIESPSSHVEDVFYTSRRLHLSVRGILAIVVVAVICWMQATGKAVDVPLRDMGIFILGFYFGSKTSRK